MSEVSVIIPAYNAAPHIREAIESVQSQTLAPLEILVVDDGSTDDTTRVLERLGDRIQLLRQPNRGAAAARNLGARASHGRWLAFLDADDVWLPHKLERQTELMNGGTGLVYSDRYNIGVLDGLPTIQSDVQPLYDNDVFEDLLLKGNAITTSTVLVDRLTFEMAGGFSEDPRLLVAEDWDLWIRIAALSRVRVCREPLVNYRLHPSGLSRTPMRMNHARICVIERALDLPRGRALSHVTKRRVWNETWVTNGWDAIRHGRRGAAAVAYLKAIVWWPFRVTPYRELLKIAIGQT